MISIMNMTPLERICSVRIAAKTISDLVLPKKNPIDEVFFKKFAIEWNVRRTLGTKENMDNFINVFNTSYMEKIIKVNSIYESALLINDFLSENKIINNKGTIRYPVSAASKIFHFYNPENVFVFDSYLQKALSFRRHGNDLTSFFEKFKKSFDENIEIIKESIDGYRKLNDELHNIGKDDKVLQIRSFDVMLMKAAGRDM